MLSARVLIYAYRSTVHRPSTVRYSFDFTLLPGIRESGAIAISIAQHPYPIPKQIIAGFSAHKTTVTNYTGESREYLQRLITAMGAESTLNMSGSNTVVIAA
ncbi:hypothetical protein PILCRDRAFT_723889 [Piloderma croceum F 1598]|uniref:BRCT domain-containing protein n=1 Tax=Piloderma croceum (strain F 1598) TaxID=765440 RepID=A0A0C3B8N0_PILCF|nr:hypothetical protein PILCRDRAFT_723889 [Piloderma croceum F 1598]